MFGRLIGLPDGSSDGSGVGSGVSGPILVRKGRAGAWTTEQLIKPFGVNLAAEKIRFLEDAAEKTYIGLDAPDGVLLEGAAKTGNGFLTAIAPGNELAE